MPQLTQEVSPEAHDGLVASKDSAARGGRQGDVVERFDRQPLEGARALVELDVGTHARRVAGVFLPQVLARAHATHAVDGTIVLDQDARAVESNCDTILTILTRSGARSSAEVSSVHFFAS